MFNSSQDTQAPNGSPSLADLKATPEQLLAEARQLAPSMCEAQDMCLQVLERSQAIIARLETLETQPPIQAVSRFAKILADYFEFLKKFVNKRTAFRLVHNRAVVSQNLKFHDEIDNLLRGLDFPEDDWRERFEGCRNAQLAAFEALSGSRMKLIGDLRDAQAQTEAMSLLLFEFNKVNSRYTPREIKVLNKAFSIVSQFSQNKTPTVATWFLPPYDFQYEETPFAWGSYGTVHHGKHYGSDVVVKRAKIASEADRAAFVKEANTWFSANKITNVVRMFGAYHLGEIPYFVCEYAANGTLNDYLFKEENRGKTWQLLLDAANGLHGLHQLKIVHNDLKCNNILVASDGIAKLTDFGLSSQLAAQQALSVMRNVGAIRWKAPEIITGSTPPSFASDVYSFAMCIYEAVSHIAPWGGAEDVVIRRNVKKGLLPSRPESSFSHEQWALLESMCALNPVDRPLMKDVVQQLEAFRDEQFNAADYSHASMDLPVGDQSEDESTTVDGLCPVSPSTASQIPHALESIAENVLQHPNGLVVSAAIVDTKISTEAGKQVGKYLVCLALSSGEEIRVWKRYSNFRYLHAYLLRDFKAHRSELPRFPRRKSLWFSASPSTIEQRKIDLDAFLKAVVASSSLPLGVDVDPQRTVYTSTKQSKVTL